MLDLVLAAGVPGEANGSVIIPSNTRTRDGVQTMRRKWITCGAMTRKGMPCQCKPIPGKRRCKFHGGLSTGPKAPEGKRRSLAALARGRILRWQVERC